ncbi:hypothetical protein [Pectobacterium parmentieri]|uniref:hypothetical protein n=1 Tax=Pectobacterium parmentieri TaxID=1905730 RepID=UPI000EADE9B8|nr:hypothetical protein [Pectobacterium parmentieri]AYH32997.1 hypothetical protein C5E19_15980 [Pectobacterium parmentieri]
MPKEINLETYYKDQQRVQNLIGHLHAPIDATTENQSRAKLLRVKTVLQYLLTEVIPNISDTNQRQEIFLWVDEMYSITRIEEYLAEKNNE